MPYITKRADFFVYVKKNSSYLTTIESKKYGGIDILAVYNCRWCEWHISVYSEKSNEFVGSFTLSMIATPTDSDLKYRVYEIMRNYLRKK